MKEKCHLTDILKDLLHTVCYILSNIILGGGGLLTGEYPKCFVDRGTLPWDFAWSFICQWADLLLLFGLAVKVSAEGDGLAPEHEEGGSGGRTPSLCTLAFRSGLLSLPNSVLTKLPGLQVGTIQTARQIY
jgi:hypothetical protein